MTDPGCRSALAGIGAGGKRTTMAARQFFLTPTVIFVAGLASGLLASGLFVCEPAWTGVLESRLEEQGLLLEQQRQAFGALTRAVNDLRAGRPIAETAKSCVTADDVPAAVAAGARPNGERPSEPIGPPSGSTAQASKHALDEAAHLVDRAASVGTWGLNDVTEFRSLLRLMSPPQRDQAMSALITALNDGHLKLAARAPF